MDGLISALNESRSVIHLFLHVLVPLLVALVYVCWLVKKQNNSPLKRLFYWAFAWMMLTMAVDVDHLLAVPIYVPDRCSILFHPLHTAGPMVVYGLMMLWPLGVHLASRVINKRDAIIGWLGAGLVVHMVLDALDCLWMKGC